MDTEQKQILLADLCARLPYDVKGITNNGVTSPLLYKGEAEWDVLTSLNYRIEKHGWKPYLRPMSSMTEEDLISYANYEFANDDIYKIVGYRCTGKGFINIYCSLIRDPEYIPAVFQRTRTSPLENWRGIDWLNAHHFDYRGLIKLGLALKAPEGMYDI